MMTLFLLLIFIGEDEITEAELEQQAQEKLLDILTIEVSLFA